MTATRVLVTGATGFIGSRLVPALLDQGYDVSAMTRRPDAYDGPGTPVGGDVHDPASLTSVLEGVEVAYYLVHSLDSADFAERDGRAARAFGEQAEKAGVRQLVYLGGLGAEGTDLSPHLRSRREVEGLLGAGGVPVTVLRAGIVVGRGGISWELTRQLVKNLPAMIVPRWASTRTQPVAVDDVIRYLVGVAGQERAHGRVFEVGGPEQMSYLEMLEVASEVATGRRVPILRVPVLTPRLSSYWLWLVTDVDVTTGRNLVDSMGTEVVVTDRSIEELVPGEPLPYAEAVRRALEDTPGAR
ncbi:MAG TPA: NAD(P)H-binding protein [Nocardioides sp.]|uniref:NAD(P)H-binding protein n=1 Tax=Nocardioides sp. TaxID=35761 RepID=UPI002E32B55F|nr:NAD(P)H-binding protein [Nocardioides sp.]HEX3930251.1 NAD(P)H-binding protein [Nocardioides sp.]